MDSLVGHGQVRSVHAGDSPVELGGVVVAAAAVVAVVDGAAAVVVPVVDGVPGHRQHVLVGEVQEGGEILKEKEINCLEKLSLLY